MVVVARHDAGPCESTSCGGPSLVSRLSSPPDPPWEMGKRYTGGRNPEGDTIVIVLTDGEPSDCRMPQIQSMLQARAKSVYVTFVMCTEEDDVVEAYNKCVDPIWGCDISDDFRSEKVRDGERR